MNARDRPTCWIIARPNGAGKTTFALEYLPEAGCQNFVNADPIAAGSRRDHRVGGGHDAGARVRGQVLEVLERAVAEALERKRRLGQYAVVWRDGRVMCIGPDAPAAPGKNE